METKQIRERLKHSLEMQVLWRNLWITLAVTIPVMLFYLIREQDHLKIFLPFALLITCVMVVPVLIFCTVRTVRIFAKPEHYIFCRGVLAQPHGGMVRHSVYYTVVLEDPEDGSKFFVDTHAIFYSHGSMSPTIEEYTNKTVTIAYNRETGMVVVIG